MKNILHTLLVFFILMNCKEAEIKPVPFSSIYGTWSFDSLIVAEGGTLAPTTQAEWASFNLKLIFENYNDDTLKLREENWPVETNFPRSSLWIVKQSQNNETHYANPLTVGYEGGDTEKEYSYYSYPQSISEQENYLILQILISPLPCEEEECILPICCYYYLSFKKE